VAALLNLSWISILSSTEKEENEIGSWEGFWGVGWNCVINNCGRRDWQIVLLFWASAGIWFVLEAKSINADSQMNIRSAMNVTLPFARKIGPPAIFNVDEQPVRVANQSVPALMLAFELFFTKRVTDVNNVYFDFYWLFSQFDFENDFPWVEKVILTESDK